MAPEMRRLRAEHAALVVLSESLAELVAAPAPPPYREIDAVRSLLRATLIRHLKCEDWALYPRLRASGDRGLADLAARFIAEMGDIGDCFIAYDTGWHEARIAADWSGFRAATTAILAALAERIEREENDLYPAAEAIGDIGAEDVETVLRRAGC